MIDTFDAIMAKLTTAYLTWTDDSPSPSPSPSPSLRAAHTDDEEGFEIAQSMGIALLGLVVAAAFATALKTLGVDVINKIRTELGL